MPRLERFLSASEQRASHNLFMRSTEETMSHTRIRKAVLIQAAVFVAGAVIASGSGAATARSATFTDPSGDAQGGPDVTRVAVSGDAASGTLAVTVTAPGYGAAVAGGLERDIVAWLDTDANDSTGDPEDGTEYGLQAWNDATGKWWNIVRWNGTAWESVPESATMRITGQGDSVTWGLNTADLGGATSFRFYVVAGNWNTTSERFDARDDAPDRGWWSYDIAAPSQTPPATPPQEAKVSLVIGGPKATPRAPRAGKPFAVSYLVKFQKLETVTVVGIESGQIRESQVLTWTPVARGKAVCTATAPAKVLTRCGLKNGDLRVSLVVPKAAAGKLLRIAVKVTASDKETGKTVTASRVVTYRIK
jgi:hypothetical protein